MNMHVTDKPATPRSDLTAHAFEATSLLKALGHEGRLTILHHLRAGGKTVSQLQALMPASQSLISTHLARLRHEGLVTFRKIGQNSFYELSDDRVRHVIDALGEVFCDGLRGHIR